MPSTAANELIRILQRILGQPLSANQQLSCEEMVLNVHVGAIKRFVERWAKDLSKKQSRVLTFDHFYVPIMNGIIVGATKYKKDQMIKFNTSTKRMIYAAMHTYLGTNFTMKELEDIVWFTQFATLQELQTAINVAQYHGVINCAYVRAIIVGNRRKAAAVLRAHDERFKKITDDPPDILTGVPNVKSLQDAWTRRLKSAIERSTEKEVECGANEKLSI